MKILFTGASSHTGYWFVKELVGGGHNVTITLRKKSEEYEGIRKKRVQELVEIATPLYDSSFGDTKFLEVIKGTSWDLFCHHASVVTNYRSYDFDAIEALEQNVNNLSVVLDSLKEVGCVHVLLSGSVSEQDEGIGTLPLDAFTPYHLSKGLTWDFFKFYVTTKSMSLGKFVIPNPFGPMEDPKFTTYIIQSWYKTPTYVRDNIHVTLLAKAYKDFAESLVKMTGVIKTNPSQYKSKQGDFAKRFADEMKSRFGMSCELNFANQTEFLEPLERVNITELDTKKLNWNEKKAWDDIAKFYVENYSK